MDSKPCSDAEVNIFDLWEILCAGWRSVLMGSLLGVVVALFAVFLIPPTFEAIALVQVGQVGQVGQVEQVEPAAKVVERMKSPSFQLRVAHVVDDQAWVNELQSVGTAASRLSLQLVKSTVAGSGALIQLKVKGRTPESARDLARAATDELVRLHEGLAKPQIDGLKHNLQVTKEKLSTAENTLKNVDQLLRSSGAKDQREAMLSIATSVRIQKENELFALQQTALQLERMLLPPMTQPTQLFEDIFVGDKAVSPKKSLLLALGLLGGLLVGIVWVFIRTAWQARNKNNASV